MESVKTIIRRRQADADLISKHMPHDDTATQYRAQQTLVALTAELAALEAVAALEAESKTIQREAHMEQLRAMPKLPKRRRGT